MSKNFERWKELADRCLYEEDPAKLAELTSEMNRALRQEQSPADHRALTPETSADASSIRAG